MEYEEVRKLTITALFSDDFLFDQIVLKGGNAMRLVHGISPRFSLDLDFSLAADFDNVEDVRARIEAALHRRFISVNKVPFDVTLDPKPATTNLRNTTWGGYLLQFKLIDQQRFDTYKSSDIRRMQREALVIGPRQGKVFTVDFSKYEYTLGKARAELDDYTIFVYPLTMIAIEKVRALCQQMKVYTLAGKNQRARARDFFDIYTILQSGVRFEDPDTRALFAPIFEAKSVPLALIGRISEEREFHRSDWPSVEETIPSGTLKTFDFYFDYLISQLKPLHSLWNE